VCQRASADRCTYKVAVGISVSVLMVPARIASARRLSRFLCK